MRIDSKQKASVVGGGAFPYVFQHIKVVGQSIPFFIIFTAAEKAVAETSAYLFAGGSNKTQACAYPAVVSVFSRGV